MQISLFAGGLNINKPGVIYNLYEEEYKWRI